MGWISKVVGAIKGDDLDEDDDFEDFAPRSGRTLPPPEVDEVATASMSDYGRKSSKVVNVHTTTQISVVLVKPEKFETASEIADHLRDKRTVVLNLEDTHRDVARRLVDFLSGVTYSLDGKIKKIANSTYIITPYTVDILGDLIDELENSGMYF